MDTPAADSSPELITPATPREQFCANVKGKSPHPGWDIFQSSFPSNCVLNTLVTPCPYRSLRLINPSPYMACTTSIDWQMIGSGPEVMVKAEHERWRHGGMYAHWDVREDTTGRYGSG